MRHNRSSCSAATAVPKWRHRSPKPGLMERDHVQVALDDDQRAPRRPLPHPLPAPGPARKASASCWNSRVSGPLTYLGLASPKRAAAEADEATTPIPDRESHSGPSTTPLPAGHPRPGAAARLPPSAPGPPRASATRKPAIRARPHSTPCPKRRIVSSAQPTATHVGEARCAFPRAEQPHELRLRRIQHAVQIQPFLLGLHSLPARLRHVQARLPPPELLPHR